MGPRPAARIALVFAAAFGSASCASIMHGTTQEVAVGSSPTAAHVSVNGIEQGTTPVVLDLKRKDRHVIKVEADGYQPYEMALTRSVSGWEWGNLVFGGVVGLAVDAITGGMYKLSPEQVQAQLAASGEAADVSRDGDQLVLLVVLRPDPSWAWVGRMEREEER